MGNPWSTLCINSSRIRGAGNIEGMVKMVYGNRTGATGAVFVLTERLTGIFDGFCTLVYVIEIIIN
jgi:hypothetical protein